LISAGEGRRRAESHGTHWGSYSPDGGGVLELPHTAVVTHPYFALLQGTVRTASEQTVAELPTISSPSTVRPGQPFFRFFFTQLWDRAYVYYQKTVLLQPAAASIQSLLFTDGQIAILNSCSYFSSSSLFLFFTTSILFLHLLSSRGDSPLFFLALAIANHDGGGKRRYKEKKEARISEPTTTCTREK